MLNHQFFVKFTYFLSFLAFLTKNQSLIGLNDLAIISFMDNKDLGFVIFLLERFKQFSRIIDHSSFDYPVYFPNSADILERVGFKDYKVCQFT